MKRVGRWLDDRRAARRRELGVDECPELFDGDVPGRLRDRHPIWGSLEDDLDRTLCHATMSIATHAAAMRARRSIVAVSAAPSIMATMIGLVVFVAFYYALSFATEIRDHKLHKYCFTPELVNRRDDQPPFQCRPQSRSQQARAGPAAR
jgi:hypothetical protein